MALASQTRSTSDFQRGLLRRSSSQNSTSTPSSPVVEAVDFCRSKPRLVELEKQLYSLANGNGNSQEVLKTCQSLLHDCDNVNGIFNVFCSCSWIDRYQDPIISQLFYELVSTQHNSSNGTLLLAELETACEELLKVLTHLGTPNTLQFNVVSLLYSLSQLSALPSSHQEAVQSYLEEIARALWPYSKPSAPNMWANEAFCDAQCDILKACGKFLEEKCPVNTERTFQMINGKLISGDISKYSRFRLLEIRELRSSGWKFSGATVNYYNTAYLKFINQFRKDMILNDVKTSPKNGLKRINSVGESNNPVNIKPVTVVRISENELRKSCENMQQELVMHDAVAEKKNVVADEKSSPLANCTELLARMNISDSIVGDNDASTANKCSTQGNPFLRKTDEGKKPSDAGSILINPGNSSEDADKVGVGKETIGHPLSHSSCDFTECSVQRASSPCSSDGSDDVFAGGCGPASSDLSTGPGNRVLPAMHRGDFKKPRRPFKSDSPVNTNTESLVTRTALSDSKENSGNNKTTLVRSQSEVTTSTESKNISHELATETHPVKAAVPSGISQDSNIAANESKLVDEQDHSTESGRENWREQKQPSTDNLQESLNDDDTRTSVLENWRERKLSGADNSLENENGRSSISENWRERKLSGSDKNQEDNNGLHSVTDNWRERRPSVDLKEPESSSTSNNATSSENWRERKSDDPGDFWGNGSHHENWRDRKSMSVDEAKKDAFSSSAQRSKRHSTGDIQLERQDSNEKGKRLPGGGFGLPKPTVHDDETSAPSDEHESPIQELHEVQITEEESQGLKGWKLGEIKNETGCRIFHNRDKCVIEIRGDPEQCKVAKKRVYSVVAASQEEFGALVPLSDEVLEHLQTEGCNILAERLALSSGACVKMINDTQLFISGHRNCVNLAKTQLAKIKVMLRYTDDPDVVSPSQEDESEEKFQQVEKLFVALGGRPRSLTSNDTITDSSTNEVSTKGSLTRDFLLGCALLPVARQRPADLSLDRTEDWVKDIVLVNGRRGEQAVLEQIGQKKGFGSPNSDSRPPANWATHAL